MRRLSWNTCVYPNRVKRFEAFWVHASASLSDIRIICLNITWAWWIWEQELAKSLNKLIRYGVSSKYKKFHYRVVFNVDFCNYYSRKPLPWNKDSHNYELKKLRVKSIFYSLFLGEQLWEIISRVPINIS